MTEKTKHAPAFPHDPLIEILPNVYFLHGSIRIGLGLRMNRNMIVIKKDNDLTLINAVRISDSELNKLDTLGTVKNVIRLGDFHGLDDQFYLDRYQAKFWSQKGHETYKELVPQSIIDKNTISPITDSEFFIFESASFPEAALLIKPIKLLITTDSIQYWNDWSYMTLPTKIILWLMGFRLGLFIGGPWLKRVTPKDGSLKSDFQNLLKLDFDSLVAAHGRLLASGANEKVARLVERTDF